MGKGRTTTGMILACLVKGIFFSWLFFLKNLLRNSYYLTHNLAYYIDMKLFISDIVHGDSTKKYYVDDTVGPDFGDDDEIAEEVIYLWADVQIVNSELKNL